MSQPNNRAKLTATMEQLDAARVSALEPIRTMSLEDLWKRPEPAKWSNGETMVHLIISMTLLKKVVGVLRPVMIASTWLGKRTDFPTECRSIYGGGRKSISAPGFVVPKVDHPLHGKPLDELLDELRNQTRQLEALVAGLDDSQLGNMKLLHPLIGIINFHQLIKAMENHEVHHLGIMQRVKERLEGQKAA